MSAKAGQRGDSVRIYYRTGYRYVEPSYRDNGTQLDRFTESVRKALHDGTIERIVVRAGTSPDGSNKANELLSERRADSLVSYIVRHSAVPESLIEKQAAGIIWNELRKQVAASGMSWRDEVLRILDDTPVWIFDERNRVVGGRKKQLMDLQGGEPYRYMLREFFPELRSSVVVTLYVRPAEKLEDTQTVREPKRMPESKSAVKNEPQPNPESASAQIPISTDAVPIDPPVVPVHKSDAPSAWVSRFAVKTNTVGWALAISNVAVEIDLSKRWSLHIPVSYSAWNYFTESAKFRILAIQPELRFWPTQGHRFFAGVHFGVASYNFALGGKWRIQDHNGTTPALGGGVSAGYRMPLGHSDRWNVEFSLGAGVYRLHYDKFRNEQNGAYVSIVSKTFFGIDNAAVLFSYTFDLKKKKGRR